MQDRQKYSYICKSRLFGKHFVNLYDNSHSYFIMRSIFLLFFICLFFLGHCAMAVPKQDFSFAYIAEGFVYNEDTNQKIAQANLTIYNASDKETIKIQTDQNGKFELLLQANRIYEIHTSHPRFLSAQVISLQTLEYRKIYVLEIPLKEVFLGKALLVEKINFEVNDTTFTKNTYPPLEKFYQILADNQSFMVEIAVHTDSRGDEAYNILLSQKRADYIVAYLIKKGISPNKIIGTGYGGTRLVNGCAKGIRCNGTDHEQNRRVEFIVKKFIE